MVFAGRYDFQRFLTYLQTKTPHNFHLINQNGTIPRFPSIYKSKEPISNFFLLKSDFYRSILGYPRCPPNVENYISGNNFLTM